MCAKGHGAQRKRNQMIKSGFLYACFAPVKREKETLLNGNKLSPGREKINPLNSISLKYKYIILGGKLVER